MAGNSFGRILRLTSYGVDFLSNFSKTKLLVAILMCTAIIHAVI